MKKLTVKARVTLWYTGLLLILLVLVLMYLFSFSDGLFTRQLREALLDVTSDAVREAEFEHGELEDDGIDFYRDGVSVFLYDTNGHLLAPRVNRGIQVDSILEDQTVKTVKNANEQWMVYDIYAVQDDTPFWVRGVVSMTGTQQTLEKMLLLAVLGVPVFALIAAAGGWWLTRRAFFAVDRMAQTADAIASGNDLSLRVPDDGSGDEFSRLARAMNLMLERLCASFDRERQFTSDASHELRSPTAVIISQCEYALTEQPSAEERTEILRAVLRQAHRMSGMISQLLMLARAESGRFQPQWEQVNLSELCEIIALEMQDAAQKASVTLKTKLSPDVIITGDETLLMRLITNLLQNAIRYNRPDGSVTLSLAAPQGGCVLAVSDTGIGIRPEELGKIWNRFYRADPSRSSEGTGLGLSMARWIAGVHGGTIEVSSVLGVGSTFSVTFS